RGPRAPVPDPPSRARAAVPHPLRGGDRHPLAVDSLSFALTHNGGVGAVAEPLEILEDAGVIVRAATLAIVILDANQHPGARAPHVLGVQHVPEMEPAGGGGCEAREDGAGYCAGIQRRAESRERRAESREPRAESR